MRLERNTVWHSSWIEAANRKLWDRRKRGAGYAEWRYLASKGHSVHGVLHFVRVRLAGLQVLSLGFLFFTRLWRFFWNFRFAIIAPERVKSVCFAFALVRLVRVRLAASLELASQSFRNGVQTVLNYFCLNANNNQCQWQPSGSIKISSY